MSVRRERRWVVDGVPVVLEGSPDLSIVASKRIRARIFAHLRNGALAGSFTAEGYGWRWRIDEERPAGARAAAERRGTVAR